MVAHGGDFVKSDPTQILQIPLALPHFLWYNVFWIYFCKTAEGIMSTFILKIIAALTMTVDHAGLLLFGNEPWMRIVGRIAFPLFAFFIAEGFRYTRDRRRYFFGILALGTVCQLVAAIFSPGEVWNVLLTFSLSLILLYLLDRSKADARFLAAFGAGLILVFFFTEYIPVDYGFFGVLLPLFAALFEKKWARLGAFAVGLTVLCLEYSSLQWYSMLSLVLLALYNGKPGKYKLKYFFYIFYPLHLAVLWGIRYLI